jgi:hypothetical protein
MKHILVLCCLILPILSGCASGQTPQLREQCSAGDQVACQELARVSYREQSDSTLQKSRPAIPSPVAAVPPGNHLP